jgi:isoquinoline 1-oxidoreductase beta subunit
MGLTRMKAALGADGMPSALWVKISGNDEAQGAPLIEYGPHKAKVAHQLLRGFHRVPYAAPNLRVEVNTMKTWVPSATWRSTGTYANVFYLESFVDEMAHAAGKDPFEFRRGLLGDQPRFKAALEKAAALAGWGTPLPPGEGRGIAICESFGTIAAEVVHVAVSPEGKLKVRHVYAAVDCGDVVNMDSATAQVEGGIMFALSAALLSEINIKQGRVVERNFRDYPMIHIGDAPAITTAFLRSDAQLGGLGEPGVPPLAPALANAIHAATGIRVRDLPIKNTSLKSA